jgi:hypothetical protein
MKKIIAALSVVLLLCSAVFAQQKLKVVVAAAGAEPPQKRNALKILETKVQEAFVNDGRYTAVTRDKLVLEQIDNEHVYQRGGAVDDNQIIALGKQYGATYICTVKSSQFMDSFMLEASLVDIETARIISVGSMKCDLVNISDLVGASAEIVRQLMNPSSVVKPGGYGSGLYWDRSRRFAGDANPMAAELTKILTRKVRVSEGTCVSGAKIAIESDGEPSCTEGMVGITCKVNTALTITQCQGEQKTVLRGVVTAADKSSKDAALQQVMRRAEKADFWNAWVKELEARGTK